MSDFVLPPLVLPPSLPEDAKAVERALNGRGSTRQMEVDDRYSFMRCQIGAYDVRKNFTLIAFGAGWPTAYLMWKLKLQTHDTIKP